MGSERFVGCGTDGHGGECLCDVIIRQPLPPLKACLSDGVQDLWMGSRVAEVQGYSRPWTDDKILDYLQDMAKFWDEFHYKVEPLQGLDSQPDDALLVKWQAIRDTVKIRMESSDEPLVSILESIGVSPQDFMDAATCKKAGSGWTVKMLQKLDDMFMDMGISYPKIQAEFGLTEHFVRGLRKYWGQRRGRRQGAVIEVEARVYMHALCRETDMTPTEIVDEVHKKFGTVYSLSTISKYRSRIKK